MASAKFPTFPNIDFKKFEMPKFEMPKFEMPKFEMPKFEMPKVDLPKVDTDAITNVAKDAVYVTIGLAVLAVQTVRSRRRELAKALTDQFGSGKAQIDDVVDAIEARLAKLDTRFVELEDKLDVAVEDLEKRLPERASALLGSVHDAAKTARKQVRGRLVKAA